MDKAYVDFEALYRMTVNETFFVTRAKATMKYEVIETNYNINDLVGIVGDKIIHLAGYVSEKKYPVDFRLVEFYDAESEEVITFLTNNFELGPLVIANIYRNRWQIESFFYDKHIIMQSWRQSPIDIQQVIHTTSRFNFA